MSCGSCARDSGSAQELPPTSSSSGQNKDTAAADVLLCLASDGKSRNLPAKVTGTPTAAIAQAFAPTSRRDNTRSHGQFSRGELIALFEKAASEIGHRSGVSLAQYVIGDLGLTRDVTDPIHLSRAWSRITKAPQFSRFIRQWKLGNNAEGFQNWLEKPCKMGQSPRRSPQESCALASAGESSSGTALCADIVERPEPQESDRPLQADRATDGGDRIAAAQARWSERQFMVATEDLKLSSSLKRGSIVFHLSDACALDMREFALAWMRYVRQAKLGRGHFVRQINNAEEIFLFPAGPGQEKEDIRQTAAMFLDSYKALPGAASPEVGLSAVASMVKGGFMQELEIKVHIALREYGARMGLANHHRMVLHSMSLIQFSSGRPPQHEHFDLLGTNCWAFIVNLSQCTCEQRTCTFQGTRLFRDEHGAPQLSPECNQYAATIFDGLSTGVPVQTLCSVLPDAVAKSTRASFDAFGSCDSAEAVRNAFCSARGDRPVRRSHTDERGAHHGHLPRSVQLEMPAVHCRDGAGGRNARD
jgi:hypothetical protein